MTGIWYLDTIIAVTAILVLGIVTVDIFTRLNATNWEKVKVEDD